MKNKFLAFTFIFPLIMAGCGGNSNKPEEYISDGSVTGVSLNASSISLSVGATYQLSATIAPKDAINTNITWSIPETDSAIASVANGKVSALSVGKTTVTVTTEDGGYTAKCAVTVVSEGGADDDGGNTGEDDDDDDDYDPTGHENITQITEAGTYSFSGELNEQIYVNAPDAKVEIELNGVTLNYSENSPIYVATCDSIDISAKKKTTNVINDNRETYTGDVEGQGKGAIYVADGDLKLKGTGTLTVNGNYYNGIHGKDDVKVQKQTLNINAVNHGIKGNDSITINSGTINIVCGGDGLKTENSDISSKGNQRGSVTIIGGNVTINSWGDAIDASYNAVFEELAADSEDYVPIEFTAKTNKYSSYDGDVIEPDTTKLYLKLDSNAYGNGNYTFACYINNQWYKATYLTKQGGGPNGGTKYIYQLERPSDASSFVLYRFSGSNVTNFSTASYNAKSEAKTFNSYYDMISVSASGSTLTFGSWSTYTSGGGGGGWGPGGQEGNTDKASSSAKGIKAANEVIINSGTIDLKAYDDGIHANADETNLENGYAPLGNVTINGGTTTIFASDDGIHADNILVINDGEVLITDSYEGLEGNVIKVNGGKATVYASDDGVNAASGTASPQILVSGGYLDVTVPTNGDTDGIDSNGIYKQTGGVVIVRGPGRASGSGGGGAFALDTESTVTLTGGTIAVFGGIERTPSASGVTKTLCSSSTVSAGEHSLTFANSDVIYVFTLKYSTNGCIVYSALGSATLK